MAFYVDTSALVKLVVAEPESDALLGWMGDEGREPVSCDLARAELLRVVRRAAPDRTVRARAVLDSVTILAVTTDIFEQAGRLEPRTLRTLDAIHLVAALVLGDELQGIVTYDDRLAEAAEANGVAPSLRRDPSQRQTPSRCEPCRRPAVILLTGVGSWSCRYTRSLERGSFEPAATPATQWFVDEVQRVDAHGWRLRVGDRDWSLDELAALPQVEAVATLDCTGGWYATQRWTGVPLSYVLTTSGLVGGRTVEARSVTGYRRRFPIGDAPDLLVATGAGGAPLSARHGAPARIVAPGRRGFWWVKWLAEVDVDDVPWWFQPPFPCGERGRRPARRALLVRGRAPGRDDAWRLGT